MPETMTTGGSESPDPERPPSYLALMKKGLALSMLGVALPMLMVLGPMLILGLALRGGNQSLLSLIELVWLLLSPFAVSWIVRLGSFEHARFARLLALQGHGPAADWWHGVRWMILILLLGALGRYAIHGPVQQIAFSWASASRLLAVAILLLGLPLLEIPAWGVVAWWSGFRMSWSAAPTPAARPSDRPSAPDPRIPPPA